MFLLVVGTCYSTGINKPSGIGLFINEVRINVGNKFIFLTSYKPAILKCNISFKVSFLCPKIFAWARDQCLEYCLWVTEHSIDFPLYLGTAITSKIPHYTIQFALLSQIMSNSFQFDVNIKWKVMGIYLIVIDIKINRLI